MPSIGDYRHDINRYRDIRGRLQTIVSRLNSAADAAGALDFEVGGAYRVNGDSSVISRRASNLRNQLNDTAGFIGGTVIPAIDNAISNAERQIAWLEEQERRRREAEARRREEERRRREEEERRREEENRR